MLAVLEERLSSDIRSESGQSQGYELADDHRAIRDFLWAESRRRGYQMEEVGGGSTTGARKSAQVGALIGIHGHRVWREYLPNVWASNKTFAVT